MRNSTLSILLFLSIISFAQTSIDKFINAPNMRTANISILVQDLSNGNVVMAHRADKQCIPASTTKLVTTATAMELLGPDYQFQTKLEYSGTITDGVLNGNIYIRGSGDPTLASEFLGDSLFYHGWINAIKNLGITRINGAVIADASIYSDDGISKKWSWEDMGNYYASGSYGLSIFDNTYAVFLNSGEIGSTPTIASIQPYIPGLKIQLTLQASDTKTDNAYFYGAPLDGNRILRGEIPANKSNFEVKGDIPNPPLYLAQKFNDWLNQNGIATTMAANTNVQLEACTRILIHRSLPLKDILTKINHKSNNHYSEHVFKQLCIRKYESCTYERASSIVKSFWKDKQLDVTQLDMFDGSGLSHANAISARFLVDVLRYERKVSPNAQAFLETLPVAGKSGTLIRLLDGTVLEGKVYAKSGTIESVKCYAGYIFWQGKEYAFAIMANNFTGTSGTVMEQIEELLLSITSL